MNACDRCMFGELTVACSWCDPLLGNEIACRQILGNGGSRGKRASDGNQSRELHCESEMRPVFGRKWSSLMPGLPMVRVLSDEARQRSVPL
jgi:hypothetical protein